MRTNFIFFHYRTPFRKVQYPPHHAVCSETRINLSHNILSLLYERCHSLFLNDAQKLCASTSAPAETARMILEYGKIPYVDENTATYFGCNWKEAKTQTPFGQLPISMLVMTSSYHRRLPSTVTAPH